MPRRGWRSARRRQEPRDRGGRCGGASAFRTHRRPRQQRRLRLSRGDRGGRGRRRSRDVRDQRVRPRRDDQGRAADHAGAKVGRDVNISSMGGFIGFPGQAITRRRNSPSRAFPNRSPGGRAAGIKVLIVEPGPFDRLGRPLAQKPKRPIDAYAGTAVARRREIQASAAISRAIRCARPRRSLQRSIRKSAAEASPRQLRL